LVMLKLLAEAAGTRAEAAKTTSAKIETLRPIVRTENFPLLRNEIRFPNPVIGARMRPFWVNH
jgi:hypothetical protein